jgi:hypothetical protein
MPKTPKGPLPAAAAPQGPRLFAWDGRWAGALLVVVTLVAYLPVLRAGFVWDDDTFLTQNPLIKAADGLRRFWATTEATDYWPVTSTTLWVEWRLWGMHAIGYHATNLLLHVAECLFLWRILTLLRIPGAFLASLIFAVHPVNVESVAWIAERKNLVAMLFFLASIFCFIRKETAPPAPARSGFGERWTGVVLAQPRLLHPRPVEQGLRGDASPGAAGDRCLAAESRGAGSAPPTALLSRGGRFCGARRMVPGARVRRSHPERRALGTDSRGGRGDLVLPLQGDLAPEPDLRLSAMARRPRGLAVVAAPAIRGRGDDPSPAKRLVAKSENGALRSPLLAAWLYFCVMLVPVMGLANVYFMKYSLVADHYEHLALDRGRCACGSRMGPVALQGLGGGRGGGGLCSRVPDLAPMPQLPRCRDALPGNDREQPLELDGA